MLSNKRDFLKIIRVVWIPVQNTALTTREIMERNDYYSVTRKPTQIIDAFDVRSTMALLHDGLSRINLASVSNRDKALQQVARAHRLLPHVFPSVTHQL